MKTSVIAVIAFILMLSFGCQRESENVIAPTNTQALLGEWRMLEPTATFTTSLTITVDKPSGGTISGIYSFNFAGKAAVNMYMTSARLLDSSTGSINVDSGVATTKVGGSKEEMQFEQTYYANLGTTTKYELTDQNKLRLYYDGGVLVYVKVK
ncbi:hypothetical protein GCM10028805_12030 [Spirosoma harenae]